ncbi:cytochrome C peroxidase [Chitinophaga qingshengii]|uniref:Cytochrome C peroxidase n=1 Tax=Chitinophaga qingshengii TaxID=1569794 RepID=A0ABR7TQP2_9BACT|nr:cytochrome C peroxidase [Chitinophaga qingshengii]
MRLELIRVSTLGIAGYDAPELQTGITEAGHSLMAVKTVLQPYLEGQGEAAAATARYLDLALSQVREDSNFVSFNRLRFLTTAMLPLQRSVNRLAGSKDAELDVFNLRAMNMGRDWDTSAPLVELGKTLFFEKQLSQNNVRSCGSCHQPDKYFTDQLPKNLALDGHSRLQRNTPTLFYAAYQHAQFWDGRAKTLEEQVLAVLHNPREMNVADGMVLSQLGKAKKYRELFSAAFPQAEDSLVTMRRIARAITAYLQTLAPMNAPFDRYLRGDKKAMTAAQENGFNLFMGKARCGTCHFVPLFNGVLPPLFDRTELEVIGTTAGADLRYPRPDADSGRFTTYPISFYKGAFKTPSLRNITVTAPYMHHGAFATLEEVMEFYNRGGGGGLGLPVPTQTLSTKPLGLNESEIKDIILFLGALTDSPAKTN